MAKFLHVRVLALTLTLALLSPTWAFALTPVATCSDLQDMDDNRTESYVLTQDIDCTGFDFDPIGDWDDEGGCEERFYGNLDGNGSAIINLTISKPDDDFVGLFCRPSGSNITNLTISNADITGYDLVGIIAGFDEYCNITDVTAGGTVTANLTVGGLAGVAQAAEFDNCHANVNVTSTSETDEGQAAGGLVGRVYENGLINNSDASGDIEGYVEVGGLVGYNMYSIIDNSYATGDVNGTLRVGGLVGSNEGYSTIDNSYATGTVSGVRSVGGFAGGIYGGSIQNCYSREDVYALSDSDNILYVGGFIGENLGDVYTSYSTGNVTANNSGEGYIVSGVGGFAGNNGDDSIYSCYSTGSVVTDSYDGVSEYNIGGFIGTNGGGYSYNNSGWVVQDGLYAVDDGDGESVAYNETSADAFFNYSHGVYTAGTNDDVWDFETIWCEIYDGVDYPILQWQSECSEEEPSCGDGTCDDDESCSSCPEDCGSCPSGHHHRDECDEDNDCDDDEVCCSGDCEKCCSDEDCDDGNDCTNDDCKNNACEYSDNTNSCDDGDACTRDDRCSAGICFGTMITTGSCAPEEEKPEAPPCTASWSCTNWGDCTNGIQRRDCTCSCADNNCAGDSSESKPCPVPGGNQTGPTGAASGVQGGQPSGGSQSLPELEKPKPQSDSSIWLYLGVVLVILLGALLLWRNSRKPRKRK